MSNWTIIKEIISNKRLCFEVRCSCGNICIRRKDHVINGRSKMCKNCSSKNTYKSYGTPNVSKAIGDLSATFYGYIKNGAKRRNLVFDVSQNYLWELFVKQKQLCALTGRQIYLSKITNKNPNYKEISASLDRIDNSKGYTKDNVQWVHKDLNRFKNNYNMKDFIQMCNEVSKYKTK